MSRVFQVLTFIFGGLGVISTIIAGVSGGFVAFLVSLLGTVVTCFCLYAVSRLFENQEAVLDLLTVIKNDMSKQNGGAPGLPDQAAEGAPGSAAKTYGAVPSNQHKPGGAAMKEEPWTCRKCGRMNEPQYKACSNCRTPR